MRRRSARAEVENDKDSESRKESTSASTNRNDAPAVASEGASFELRRPRHGGWKGVEQGQEAAMLRGEPGHCIGELRVLTLMEFNCRSFV